jgi:exonuclease III
MTMGDKLKIRSLNINGIQCRKKRDKVFNKLSQYKGEILLLQETHSTALDERNYNNKWGSNVFFSHGTSKSRGVCTILPKGFKGKGELLYSDLEGRIVLVKITINSKEFIICNIYAPTSSYENEQIELLVDLNAQLTDHLGSNIILCGDWNVIMDNYLDKKSVRSQNCTNTKYRDGLKILLDEIDLTDCWRLVNPGKRKFTCRSGKKGETVTQTRIDMIFTSENLLNILSDVKIEAGFMSDHNFTTVSLILSENKRGRGSWKFNNILLSDKEYVVMIKKLIAQEIIDNNCYEDKGFLWDYIKMRVRSETMLYSGEIQKNKRIYLQNLTDELEKLDVDYMDNPNDETLHMLELARKNIEDLNNEKMKSSMFRSKCEWMEHGEKNSKYFLNLEKYNYTNKTITKLEVNNKTIKDEKLILGEIKSYYEKLYGCNNTDKKKLHEVLENIPKLTESQKSLTKGIVTYDECLKALKSLANGKTPGQDGITTDFYKFFWIDISDIVLDSINYAFTKNEMSLDQRSGIISLSPKKNKIRTFLKNWRPITLLTVDYKLLAKALAMRLHTILPDYVDESQFGYIKDRYIGENIRCIIDINTMCEVNHIEAYAIQIDFEKAFDSINWEFMFISLEHMNFDPDFIRWVKILYKNTTSCVINNGHKTESFTLKRGVHQGCPLSALLFIILVQVLQHMLQTDNEISGINIGGKDIKILQMADDTTILTSDINDVPKILTLLDTFYHISGLKTNTEKTIAYKLGNDQNFDIPPNHLDLNWGKLPINLLGITISKDKETLKNENFMKKVTGIDVLTKIWAGRNLSLKGKLTIINALLIPKLVYPCTILDVPAEIIQLATEIIKTFFWNWKRPKIKVDTLIRNIKDGGLKFPCLDCKITSWKLLWAIRALKFEESKPLWTRIVDTLLPNGITFTYLLKSRPTKEILSKYCPNLPEFYKNIILTWTDLNDKATVITKETILNTPIWLNKAIVAKNVPLYCGNSASNNILYIKDILNTEGQFMSHLDINRKYNSRCTFLDILRIRLTIPHSWKMIIEGNGEEILEGETLFNKLQRLKSLKTKDLYWILLGYKHDCKSLPNTQLYWENMYKMDHDTMEIVYTLPYKVTRSTNLQALQYKILYKIINCNHWLRKINILDSAKCRFCEEEETIEHFFFRCPLTKQFWKVFLSWWNHNGNSYTNALYEKDILMGYMREKSDSKILNCCILIGKAMILKEKNLNKQPDLYIYLCDLKEYLDIELSIARKHSTIDKLVDAWGEIMEI